MGVIAARNGHIETGCNTHPLVRWPICFALRWARKDAERNQLREKAVVRRRDKDWLHREVDCDSVGGV
jgi:hypothetical protein